MRSKRKKWTAVICCILCVSGLLSACSAEGSKTGDNQGADSSPTTLRVAVFDRGNPGGSDPTNNFYTNWIQEQCREQLNLEVEFVKVSRSEEKQQLNSMMAAKTAPDICFTYDIGMFNDFSQNGGLTDLSDLIDQYGEHLKQTLGADLIKEYGTHKDIQTAIPARRVLDGKFATYIRKDWLDALGLPLPTTTEEYHEALKQIKQKNPGNVDNLVLLTTSSDIANLCGPLVESFIDLTVPERELYMNGVNDSSILRAGYKEGVRLLNQFYHEGLLDPEFALYKDYDDLMDNAISRGNVASFMHNWDWPARPQPGLIRELKGNVPSAELVPIDPFVNAQGNHAKSLYDPVGLRVFVPSFSDNAEAAVQYLNWLAKPETYQFLQAGIEGETFDMVDGIPLLREIEGEKIMNSLNNIDYILILNGVELNDPDKNVQFVTNAYPGAEEVAQKAYQISINDGFRFPRLPGVSIDSEAGVSVTLKEKERALFSTSIVAPPDQFDAVWDAGVADWLASGGETARQERAAAWDASH